MFWHEHCCGEVRLGVAGGSWRTAELGKHVETPCSCVTHRVMAGKTWCLHIEIDPRVDEGVAICRNGQLSTSVFIFQ